MNNNETIAKWYIFSKALTLTHNDTVLRPALSIQDKRKKTHIGQYFYSSEKLKRKTSVKPLHSIVSLFFPLSQLQLNSVASSLSHSVYNCTTEMFCFYNFLFYFYCVLNQ